jgi:hypothetical protein
MICFVSSDVEGLPADQDGVRFIRLGETRTVAA